jgi:phage FluMu protein Com
MHPTYKCKECGKKRVQYHYHYVQRVDTPTVSYTTYRCPDCRALNYLNIRGGLEYWNKQETRHGN